MIPLPHWRRGLDGQLARTNTPHRLWRLMLAAACAAEELLGRGEDAPREEKAYPSALVQESPEVCSAQVWTRPLILRLPVNRHRGEPGHYLNSERGARFTFTRIILRNGKASFLETLVDIRPMQRFDDALAPVCHGHGRLPRP